jgi:hypothetical protein
MSGKKAFVVLVAVLSVLSTTSAAWSFFGFTRKGGWVMPCSLAGVNPVHHPDIFGNPAVAREYGFVQSRDGTWHVQDNCLRGRR